MMNTTSDSTALNKDLNTVSNDTATNGVKPELTEQDLEDYRAEYEKIQEDINTLRLVLNEKLKREHELKLLLGISFVDEIKQDFQEGFNQIKQTTVFQTLSNFGTTVAQNDAVQKTTAGLKTATQKITPAFQTFGSSFKTRLGDMRNSNVFKSVEGKLGSTLNTVTNKMKGSKSEYGVDGLNEQDTTSVPTSNTIHNISKVEPLLEEK